MKDMRITVTFKESERYLYEEIMKHSGKANYIKDILAKNIKEEKPEKIKNFFE